MGVEPSRPSGAESPHVVEAPPRPTAPARVLIGGVRLYQIARHGRPSPCRFSPSCSTYATEALELHGALRGFLLTIGPLARCHPWGGQGFDQVPDKKASIRV